MRIYIATPYEAILRNGYTTLRVKSEATLGISRARALFSSSCELFSPVLEWGSRHKDMPRVEVMKLCFKALDSCDLLFIPTLLHTTDSKGIYDEWVRAKANGKMILFESAKVASLFESKLVCDEL
ncbi:hypothetical protein [Campylobacter corcagiensis]|uniref:DUF4406 domain-containing protein n=1 Tax=Campylobacter corcagiensis TaxID=1448857 RepID=A0A7M1LFU5_9BACT|nr:hypothetical protein [Campylobacter corcagiensis]QKF64523.1 DUF4406 domain-containing protein [Campylobacter corcagiensis]QOQ87300.1 hypothetical protein IMC76_00275 [Campylobacter corcagiensis]